MALRKHSLRSGLVVLFLCGLAGCSSSESAPDQVGPERGTGSTASASSVRTDLARAIIVGATHGASDGDASMRRDVEAWTARLSDRAICAAAQRADEHPLFSMGVSISNARRTVVFDLASSRVAVFTKSGGESMPDQERLYTFVSRAQTSGEGVAPPFDEEGAPDTATPSPATAPALRAFVGVDGAAYGDSFAVSEIATRTFATTTSFVRMKTTGAGGAMHAAIESTPRSTLDARAATAATIFGWTRIDDALATKAALVAIAAGRSKELCAAARTSVRTASLRPLDGDFDFQTFDFDAEIGEWLGSAPASTSSGTSETESMFDLSETASCANTAELACTGTSLCVEAAGSYCCAGPRPVTKPCTNNAQCSGNESCIMASNEPDADGNILTCADTSGAACGAIESSSACVARGGSCSLGKKCCAGSVCAFGGEREDTFCQAPGQTNWEGQCTQARKGAAVKLGTSASAKTCHLINGAEYASECFEMKNGYCVIGYNGDCGNGEYAIALGDLIQLPRDNCKM